MIGKFLKTLIVLVLGMVLGVGAIIGGLVAGVATVATQPLGQVAGLLLGDDTDKYLSDDAQDDTLSDAINKITSIMQDGTVADLEEYIPYIGDLLEGLGENEMLNSLVSIDMDRLGETKFSSLMSFNLSEIMDAVDITANLESVFAITGISLQDFGFGFIEDLSVYNEDGYYEQEITLGELFVKADSSDLNNSNIDLYKKTTSNGKVVYERVPYDKLKKAELSSYYKFVGATDISNYYYKQSETQYNPMFKVTTGGNVTVLNAPALNKTAYRRYQALSKAPIVPVDQFVDTLMTRVFDITYRDLEIVLTSLTSGTGMDATKVLEGLLPPVEDGSTQLKTLDEATLSDILRPLNVDFIRVATVLEGIGIFDPDAPTGENMIGDIISLVAYDSAENPRTLENVLESLMDEVMVKDLVDCIPLNLEELEGILDLILLDKDGNKLSINGVLENVKDIQNTLYTADVFNALGLTMFLEDGSFYDLACLLAYQDGNPDNTDVDNKLTIGGTIEKLRNFKDIKVIDVINAVGINLSDFQGVIDLLCYKDVDGDFDDVENQRTISELLTYLKNFGDIYTADVIEAIGINLSGIQALIDLFIYDDAGNPLTIYDTLDRARGFMNLYAADVLNAVDIDLGSLENIVNLLIYKDINGDLNDDANKYTVNEVIVKVGDLQNSFKTVELVDALDELVTVLKEENIREVLDIFMYGDVDDDGVEDELTIAQTIEKALDFDKYLYTADIVNLLDINLITGDGQFAEVVNLIAYKDVDGDLEDDANKYTVSETINVLGDFQNSLKTIDIVNALDFITILSEENIRKVINIFAYDNPDGDLEDDENKLSIAGTIEKAKDFDENLYTADIVNALDIGLITGDGQFAKIINLIAYKDVDGDLEDNANKYTVSETIDVIGDIQNKLYTIDVVNALDFITILSNEEIRKVINTFAYEDGTETSAKLSIAGTIEKAKDFDENLYTADIVNALDIGLITGDGQFAKIVNLIAYKDVDGDLEDNANKYTVSETINVLGDFQNSLYTIDIVNALEFITILSEEKVREVINTFAYEDGTETSAKLSIAGTIEKARAFDQHLKTIDIVNAIDIDILVGDGMFAKVVNLIAYDDPSGDLEDDANKLNINGTLEKVFDFKNSLYTQDVIDALDFITILHEEGMIKDFVALVTYGDPDGDGTEQKLTIGETLEKILAVEEFYTADIVNALGLDIITDDGQFADIVNLIAYKDVDGDLEDDANKWTVGETIANLKDFQNTLYTIDVINAIGLTMFEEPAIKSIVTTFAYDDGTETGVKLTIAETVDKITHFLDYLYTADLIDAIGIDALKEGVIGNILDIFSYHDTKGDKTDDENKLTLQETIDKVLAITDLYTADFVVALEIDAINEGGKFAFLVDPLAYKDATADREDDSNKYTIAETINRVPDVYDIYKTLDILDAFGLDFLTEGVIGNVINIIATTDGERLTLKGTVDKVLNFTDLYTADVIGALEIDALSEGGDYFFVVKALAYEDGDNTNVDLSNKLTVGGTINHVLSNFMDIFYTADIVGVVEGFIPALGEGAIAKIIDVFCYEDVSGDLESVENKYTLRETVESVKDLPNKIKTADVVDALGIPMLNEGTIGSIVDILCYEDEQGDHDDDSNKLTIAQTIEKAQSFQDFIYTADIAELTGLTLITGDGQFAPLFNLIAYVDGNPENKDIHNKYKLGQSINMIFDFQNAFYTYEIVDALNMSIFNEGGQFHDVVTLLAYEDGTVDGEPLLIAGTIDKVINFADTVPILDLKDALNMVDFAEPVQNLIELVGIDVNTGERLPVNGAIDNLKKRTIGEVCEAVGFALENYGLCGPNSVAELTIGDVMENLDLWYVLDRVDLAAVLEASQGSNILDGAAKYIALNRLTTEYLATLGYTLDENNFVTDAVLYNENGEVINYTQSKEDYITFDKEQNAWVYGERIYLIDTATGDYIYEAYSLPIASALYSVRDTVKASNLVTRVNTITIGELIDGYTTLKRYELMRKIIPATTTLSKLMSGDAVKEISLVDVLGESKVAESKILSAMAYYPDGSKVYVSELSARIKNVTVAEIMDGYDDVADTLLEKVLPGTVKINDIAGELTLEKIQTRLTLVDVLGESAFENNLILQAIGKDTQIGGIADAINGLKIDDVIENYGTGNTELLGKIIESGTLITDIGSINISEKVDALTLDELGITFDYEDGDTDSDKATKDVLNHLLTKMDDEGNYTEKATVGEISETLQSNLPSLKLEEFLAISGGADGSPVLQALVDKGSTIGTLADDIKGILLKDCINANIMHRVTVEELTEGNSSGFGSALYTLDAGDTDAVTDDVYKLVIDTACVTSYFSLTDGLYYYTSLDTTSTETIDGVEYTNYYTVNANAKVWFLVFAKVEDDSTTEPTDLTELVDGYKCTTEYGAYDKISYSSNYSATLDTVGNEVNIDVTDLKIKLLVDLGMFDTSKLTSTAQGAIRFSFDVDFTEMIEQTIISRSNQYDTTNS